jgi:hypothetical protein
MKKIRSFATITFVILLTCSCQKFNFWDHHDQDEQDTNPQVALDWYTLQMRILLERNSALNGVYVAYIGIGLYESVQPGIKNAVSLSSKLYQMRQCLRLNITNLIIGR